MTDPQVLTDDNQGVQNAVTNAIQIGANSFALFLKSQRKWDNPPLSTEAKDLFISACKHHEYNAAEHAVPHGSYLVNLAQPDPTKAEQAYKGFLDDLKRCEALGIRLYNFHPGTTGGEPRPEAIGRIAAQLNKAHKETETVITLLENMAGAGNVIGNSWEDLRDIIELVEDKSRVGVCIDTCHAFAAGHDLRSPEAFSGTMSAFDHIVGEKYLKAFHGKIYCATNGTRYIDANRSQRQQGSFQVQPRPSCQHRHWLSGPARIPQLDEPRAICRQADGLGDTH